MSNSIENRIIIESELIRGGDSRYIIYDPDDCEGVVQFLVKVLVSNLWDPDQNGINKYLILKDKEFQNELDILVEKYVSKFKLNNNIFVDQDTKLMWQVNTSNKRMTYSEAEQYCENLKYNNYSDWRMPTIQELFSLIDYTKQSPACVIGNSNNDFYWSSTDFINAEETKFVVFFSIGDIDRRIVSREFYVRAVRSI